MKVLPGAAQLHFEGRFDGSDPSGPRFEWPGSTVWLRFDGTGAKVTLSEQSLETDEYGHAAHNWYDVFVDGQPAQPLLAAEGTQSYLLAAGLVRGEHRLALRKRTEAYVGVGQLLGFELDPGSKVLAAESPQRRLEFIGDSVTVGFGVDGSDASCLFSADTENYSHSYAALTAQDLGAAQIAVASSGAGVYRNWGGSTVETIGDLYPRVLPTDPASHWNFSAWTPDAVVINLGTEDFTSGDPGHDAFVGAYRSLLGRVRQTYPSALIVVALGPMLSDLWPQGAQALSRARAYVSEVVNATADPRVKLIEFDNQDEAGSYGCKSHPNAATHRRVADQLTAYLHAQLGW
ncbi:MAG: SGNH/GDSL hydrolase family protein [Myxococcales bacterium]